MNIELEAVYVIWLREVKRYFRAKERIISSLAMPLLWFLIFGIGLGPSIRFKSLDMEYSSFLAPGIVAMTLLFTSIFSGVSVIWDREFGFLREMLVAPVSRLSIVVGKSLGSATTAVIQGTMILVLSMLIGVKFTFLSILVLIPLMLVISFGFVSLGVAIASLMETMEGFHMIMRLLVQPMFFLSGAFFPINTLPEWLRYIVYINPMTHGVEVLRYVAIGFSSFPFHLSLFFTLMFSVITSLVGSYTFSRRQ